MFEIFKDAIVGLANDSGFMNIGIKDIIMILVSFVFMYLAIAKDFEPLLLLPISFGILLTNLPGAEMYHPELFVIDEAGHIDVLNVLTNGGLLDLLYLGVKLQIYPPLIFLGIGCMTDFSPLIANPKSFLLGAAAQAGIFVTFIGAALLGMSPTECGAIAIIGGADGPTAIYVSSRLLKPTDTINTGTIALAAYTYMALVPIIQPPVIKALTTKNERRIRMDNSSIQVSKLTKILFPIIITIVAGIVAPSSASLIGFLMFGNLIRECGVLDSLSDTAQHVLANLVTIFLGFTIANQMVAEKFLQPATLLILGLGLFAFIFDTAGGVLFAKLLNVFLPKDKKLNPMIGAAGISAFPMSGRVVHKLGLAEDNQNFLLMHSIGVNVSGQIASVIAGGLILNFFM